MKIKEKGLTGKAAVVRKETIGNRRGFNAFRDKNDKGKSNGDADKDKPPVEIWLEFMGNKIRVYDEEGSGTVKEDDVPHVKGATLKFDGCGGSVHYNDIKVCFNSSCFLYLNDGVESITRKIHKSPVHSIHKWR
jgi:lupus La protein